MSHASCIDPFDAPVKANVAVAAYVPVLPRFCARSAPILRRESPWGTNRRSHIMRGMQPLQQTLLGAGDPAIDEHVAFERVALDNTSWVDVARGWLLGADELLEALARDVPWRQGRRW